MCTQEICVKCLLNCQTKTKKLIKKKLIKIGKNLHKMCLIAPKSAKLQPYVMLLKKLEFETNIVSTFHLCL